MAFVYKITCSVNKKSYIGITQRTVEERWAEHICNSNLSRSTSALARAIKKYGIDAFEIVVLETVNTAEEAASRERALILEFNTASPNGYNLTSGGDGILCGVTFTQEARQKIKIALKGRVFSDEHRRKLSDANRRRVRSPLTEEQKMMLVEANKLAVAKIKGKPLSEETKTKLRASMVGRKLPPRSDEYREKMRLAKSGKKRKPFSEEHKRAISEALKKRYEAA